MACLAPVGNLTSLHVKMVKLCITVPALPRLRDLRLDCARTLCMSFEDARVSAENLLGFELVFSSMCTEESVACFLGTLAAAGKQFRWQQYSKMRRRPDGSMCEHKFYRMQYGSYGIMASSDPWEDLFTACGCEGCPAWSGLGLNWTSRGHMVYEKTGYAQEVPILRPGERLEFLDAMKCPCDRHWTYADMMTQTVTTTSLE